MKQCWIICPQKLDLDHPSADVLQQPLACIGVRQLAKRIPRHSSGDSKGLFPENSLDVLTVLC